jgi:hypothetical protein
MQAKEAAGTTLPVARTPSFQIPVRAFPWSLFIPHYSSLSLSLSLFFFRFSAFSISRLSVPSTG